MNSSNQRKSGAILSYISIMVNTIIQLIYTPFLIRMLGQSEYGLYSLISSIIGYLSVLDLGFGNAIVVYTAKYRVLGKKEEEQKLHGMFKIIFYIIGIIAIALGIVLFYNIDFIFKNTMSDVELYKTKIMILILTFNLGFTFSFSIYSSIITAYERFTYKKMIAIIGSLLKPLIMIPLLFLGCKSITMCLVITIVNIIILLSNYVYCKKNLKLKIKYMGFEKKIFTTIFGYSIWIFLQVIVDKVNWSIDQFILGAISGTIAVSIYSIASTLNQMFIQLSTAISGVFLPKISQMVAKDEKPCELTKEMTKIGRIQYYIIFLMCSSLIVFGKTFIKLWAGVEFEESYYVALILIIPACLPLIQTIGLSILQSMNKYKFFSVVNFIVAIMNLAISIVLAKKYGAIGAAIGTAIPMILCNVILVNIYYYKIIKLNVLEFWKDILLNTLKLMLPLIITIIFKYTIKLSEFKSLIIFGGLYIILYTLVSYKFVMNDYEKSLVTSIIKKIKK